MSLCALECHLKLSLAWCSTYGDRGSIPWTLSEHPINGRTSLCWDVHLPLYWLVGGLTHPHVFKHSRHPCRIHPHKFSTCCHRCTEISAAVSLSEKMAGEFPPLIHLLSSFQFNCITYWLILYLWVDSMVRLPLAAYHPGSINHNSKPHDEQWKTQPSKRFFRTDELINIPHRWLTKEIASS